MSRIGIIAVLAAAVFASASSFSPTPKWTKPAVARAIARMQGTPICYFATVDETGEGT